MGFAWKNIILVGFGGGIGAVLRYLVSGWVHGRITGGVFPWGTFTVNVMGCLLIGLLGGWSENLPVFTPATRLFVFMGILGGFTTFSSFGYETFQMLFAGNPASALVNIGLSVFACLFAVWIGFQLSNVS